MTKWYFIIPIVVAVLLLLLMILLHFKKKSVLKKVLAMTLSEKLELLNRLAEPVGYLYEPRQNLFIARHDAPQKHFGYTTLYDLSAAYFNMVFDYETFYFDYNGRTWLIEMWKGQYGINSGCELGVYYADTILAPDQYDSTLFHAVDAKDMLDITLKLNKCATQKCSEFSTLGHVRSRHWWLTLFRMGTFSKPEELFVNVSLRFYNQAMMHQFLDSFRNTLPETPYKVSGPTMYFTFRKSHRQYPLFKRFVRRTALLACRIYCGLFNHITKPFTKSGDKLLYLYYYLPVAVKLVLKPKKQK